MHKSFVAITGDSAHPCGYCHSKRDTSLSFGMWAYSLTCQDYQDLIDRGWRRSGKYLYKPELSTSCCPQYSIRLNVNELTLSRSQKKVIRKVKQFVQRSHGSEKDEDMEGSTTTISKGNPSLSSGVAFRGSKESKDSMLDNLIMDAELGDRLEVLTVPSKFEKETFDLYCRYQQEIHHDDIEELTEKKYKRFLVDSPLEPIKSRSSSSQPGFGSFHQKYYIDKKLIAVGVIDILPACVSSVYFLWDPDYKDLSLGKYSALREAWFAKSIIKIPFYYMGFYIQSCPKMRYKADYKPSYLLSPVTYTWHQYSQCAPLLDESPYVVFSEKLNHETNELTSIDETSPTDLDNVVIISGGELKLLKNVLPLPSNSLTDIKKAVELIGNIVANRIILVLD